MVDGVVILGLVVALVLLVSVLEAQISYLERQLAELRGRPTTSKEFFPPRIMERLILMLALSAGGLAFWYVGRDLYARFWG